MSSKLIKVKLYTILTLKQILGQREFDVSIQEGSTVKSLLAWMIERWGDKLTPHLFQPGSDRVLPHIRLMLNGRDIQFLNGVDTVLHDGDEFSMLPILTGGLLKTKEQPMPFERVNNLQVYYEVHGEGEVIILMHHGFGCTKIWNTIYPSFVAEGYKVVMFDRRGFGRSEPGDDFQEFYESDRYRPESVEELLIIKERLGIKECHLVGQCEGGVVGVDYSVKYPEEVKTLVAATTQCYSKVPMTELNRATLVETFSDLEPGLQLKLTDWHGGAAESRYNQFARCGGAYGSGYFDLRPVLASVGCPTLVLYPDRSSIFEVEQAIAFYRNLPRGELAVFPKCGHNTYEQRPEDYVRTVLDFLRRATKGEQDRTNRQAMTCLA